MPIAYYCLIALFLMPFVPLFWVKREKAYDNGNPRASYQNLTGLPARALACHQNHLEALLFFAVAFFIAIAFNIDGELIDLTSIGFVLARIAYTAFYLADAPTPRSLAWVGGFLCALGLLISPILG